MTRKVGGRTCAVASHLPSIAPPRQLLAGGSLLPREVQSIFPNWSRHKPGPTAKRTGTRRWENATVEARAHRPRQAEERLAIGPSYSTFDLVFAHVRDRPHGLRHTLATLRLLDGIPSKVVLRRLGRPSPKPSRALRTGRPRRRERLRVGVLASAHHVVARQTRAPWHVAGNSVLA
jgi:hypothetical protein